MFSKNLKFYRMKKNLSKKDLAQRCGLSPMSITNYENGDRMPSMDQLKKLASVLGVKVSDFLAVRNENLVFSHEEFRKHAKLSKGKQEYIRECVEEYFSRFFTAVELLGGEVLPEAPVCHSLPLSKDVENDARMLREHLGLAVEGPINELITILENKGILIYVCDIDEDSFSGMNGFVNERPYIIVNGRMSPERNRSTISHELAHLFFIWPEEMDDKSREKYATAISGAFLFPAEDAIRELGVHRQRITMDMTLVCKEYGISMMMLAKRARLAGIISAQSEEIFFKWASKQGWRTNEPSRIAPEHSGLFDQLVFRAVSEEEISVQKGAELLQIPYEEVAKQCYLEV